MYHDYYDAKQNGHNRSEAEYFARRKYDQAKGLNHPNAYYAAVFTVTERTIRRWNAALEASGMMVTATVTYTRDNRGQIRTNPRHRKFLNKTTRSHNEWEKITTYNRKKKQHDTLKWKRHFQQRNHTDTTPRDTHYKHFNNLDQTKIARQIAIQRYGLAAVEELEALTG